MLPNANHFIGPSFLWLSKPFWRCLGSYLACIQQLVCMNHLVSYHLKAMSQNSGRWMAWICVLASNHPADVKAPVNCSACWIVGQGGRVSLWHFFFYSLKEVLVLHSLVSWLIYFLQKCCIGVLNVSGCLHTDNYKEVVITGYTQAEARSLT